MGSTGTAPIRVQIQAATAFTITQSEFYRRSEFYGVANDVDENRRRRLHGRPLLGSGWNRPLFLNSHKDPYSWWHPDLPDIVLVHSKLRKASLYRVRLPREVAWSAAFSFRGFMRVPDVIPRSTLGIKN